MITSDSTLKQWIEQTPEDALVLSAEGGLILLRKSQQEVCPKPAKKWVLAENSAHGMSVFFRPACGKWSCPFCGKRLMWKCVISGREGARTLHERGEPITFVTVTSHERLSATRSLAVLPHAWNNLNRRLKRSTPHSGAYFGFPEQHEDGRWHMHFLVAAALGKAWWKDNARSCGLGYMADEKEVKSAGGVAGYIVKYQTKLLQRTDLPPHFRRVRHSNSWPKLPPLPEVAGWTFTPMDTPASTRVLASQRIDCGETVYFADNQSSWEIVRSTADFER